MNPYAEEQTNAMKGSFDLFGKYQILQSGKKDERGELLKEFKQKSSYDYPRLCSLLWWVGYDQNGVKDKERELRDLYYIQSDCKQAVARGVTWMAAFHTAVNIDSDR